MSELPYQARVWDWALACFGLEIATEQRERNHRFLEESIELVQSNGITASEAHQLVDYVFGRPIGDTYQEIGGVMVTLALLCSVADNIDMAEAGETELARIWGKMEKIRAKQAAKPKHGPLPEAEPDCDAEISRLRSALEAANTRLSISNQLIAEFNVYDHDTWAIHEENRKCITKIEAALGKRVGN